ncbi:lanthionine synthetase C family protein [Streptomyces coeruleorubidus]|uniref:lanthionine synthetase C family protein n=1 Tax=Streptomyces coeruleorubidus TaxID=116188 RepID=UPI0033C5F053
MPTHTRTSPSDRTSGPHWGRVALPAPLTARARQAADRVADALAGPHLLPELAARAAAQSDDAVWDGSSLSHGHAGLALLHLHAARAGGGRAAYDRAFAFLRAAFEHTETEPVPEPGMFGGTSGLALALADCAADEPRFRPSLDRLHERLADQVLAVDRPSGAVADHDYDAINGAAGVLAHQCTVDSPSPRMREATDRTLDFLLRLSTGDGPPYALAVAPRWYPLDEYRDDYPHGYLNLGLSHGVPGVAGALAAALRAGHRAPETRTALRGLVDWLLAVRLTDAQGPLWARGVPLDANGRTVPNDALPHAHDQLAWCYGTAGVAVALLRAAEALGDDAAGSAAADAFDAVLRRGPGRGTVLSPTLCHGMAGLVAVCAEFAASGRSPNAEAALPSLVGELLAYAEDDRPLLFADQDVPGNFVDDPGLLTGAAGVALTLFAVTGRDRPRWFTAFFLS